MQATAERLAGIKGDLALVSILALGNDYLPGVAELSLGGSGGRQGLWKAYLSLRARPEFHGR